MVISQPPPKQPPLHLPDANDNHNNNNDENKDNHNDENKDNNNNNKTNNNNNNVTNDKDRAVAAARAPTTSSSSSASSLSLPTVDKPSPTPHHHRYPIDTHNNSNDGGPSISPTTTNSCLVQMFCYAPQQILHSSRQARRRLSGSSASSWTAKDDDDDDDSSVSSTRSTRSQQRRQRQRRQRQKSQNKKPRRQKARRRGSGLWGSLACPKKHVAFETNTIVYIDNNDFANNLNDDDEFSWESRIAACWYSKDELAQFRHTNTETAQALAQRDEQDQNAAAALMGSSSSYASVVLRVYHDCCRTSNQLVLATSQRTLQNTRKLRVVRRDPEFRVWVQGTVARWGLEQASLPTLTHDVATRRGRLLTTIKVMQAKIPDKTLRRELLAQASLNTSRPAQLFAQQLGAAGAPTTPLSSSVSSLHRTNF